MTLTTTRYLDPSAPKSKPLLVHFLDCSSNCALRHLIHLPLLKFETSLNIDWCTRCTYLSDGFQNSSVFCSLSWPKWMNIELLLKMSRQKLMNPNLMRSFLKAFCDCIFFLFFSFLILLCRKYIFDSIIGQFTLKYYESSHGTASTISSHIFVSNLVAMKKEKACYIHGWN